VRGLLVRQLNAKKSVTITMSKTKKVSLLVTSLFLLALFSVSAQAQQLPGKHPGYLHALSDLRTARWLLLHQPGDAKVYQGEDVAVQEIEAIIAEIKHASIDDGKNINDHMNIDVHEHGSRLRRAIESLQTARTDIMSEEDNPEVSTLRHHALERIDRAIHAAGQAHDQWMHDNPGAH
jgi:hypothetical protein